MACRPKHRWAYIVALAALLCVVGMVTVLCGCETWGKASATDGSQAPTTGVPTGDQDLPAFTGEAPSPRAGQSTACDPVSGKIVLFGGADYYGEDMLNDTWAYDPVANTWTDLDPDGDVPEGRVLASFIYDPVTRTMILFGGIGHEDSLGDTWAYDLAANTWTKLADSEEHQPDTTQTSVYGSASDPAAKSLVRNAMTAIESAYVDLRTFDAAEMTPSILQSIEPSISFVRGADQSVALAPTALASSYTVDYFGAGDTYAVGTMSASGTTFGVVVDKRAGGGNTLYIDGSAEDW
jgi:hypothetical protein